MKVVNIYDSAPAVYVGRKSNGMHYGNPFSHKSGTLAIVKVTSVKEAIVAFEEWLDGVDYQDVEPERRQWILDHLNDLTGQNLKCYCAPHLCHADVLLKKANR